MNPRQQTRLTRLTQVHDSRDRSGQAGFGVELVTRRFVGGVLLQVAEGLDLA